MVTCVYQRMDRGWYSEGVESPQSEPRRESLRVPGAPGLRCRVLLVSLLAGITAACHDGGGNRKARRVVEGELSLELPRTFDAIDVSVEQGNPNFTETNSAYVRIATEEERAIQWMRQLGAMEIGPGELFRMPTRNFPEELAWWKPDVSSGRRFLLRSEGRRDLWFLVESQAIYIFLP